MELYEKLKNELGYVPNVIKKIERTPMEDEWSSSAGGSHSKHKRAWWWDGSCLFPTDITLNGNWGTGCGRQGETQLSIDIPEGKTHLVLFWEDYEEGRMDEESILIITVKDLLSEIADSEKRIKEQLKKAL